jgi:hypothetical protein
VADGRQARFFAASRTRAGVNLRWWTGTGIGALGFMRAQNGFYKLELKNVDGPSAWAGPTRASS